MVTVFRIFDGEFIDPVRIEVPQRRPSGVILAKQDEIPAFLRISASARISWDWQPFGEATSTRVDRYRRSAR
jgi:hypothetical protein